MNPHLVVTIKSLKLNACGYRYARFISATSALAVAFLLTATSAFARSADTDVFLQNAVRTPGSGRVNVILRTSHSLTAAEEAKLGHLGAYLYRHLSIIGGCAVSTPERSLRQMLELPFVEHASADVELRKADAYTVGASGANVAWQQYGASGKGVGVAIVDSGIHPGSDLGGNGLFSPRIVASANFSPDAFTTDDLCGHGTHVAGIVGGNGAMSSGNAYFQTYLGIAPQINFVNARVLDSNGVGTVSQVIAGIAWVVATKPLYNTRVLNLSVGHPVGESYVTDPLCIAVEAAWKSGIVVVVAAGNNGRENATPTAGADNSGYGAAYGTIAAPGNDPYVITVGAMKKVDGNRNDDTIASYSSRGPSRLDFVCKPDIVAPGNQIVSVLSPGSYLDKTYLSVGGVPWAAYVNLPAAGYSTNYFEMSGTSMAAPVVAGAAALMLQLQPGLSPDSVKARLMVTADKWLAPDGTGDMFTYGAGYLDIPAALASNIVSLPYAMSPTASRQPNQTVTLNMTLSILDGTIFGSGLLDPGDVWGSRAVWGEGGAANVDASRAVWGEGFWTDDSTYPESTACADLSVIALKGD